MREVFPRKRGFSTHHASRVLLHIQDFSCWLIFLTLSMKKKDWNRLSHVPTAAGAAAGPALHPPRTRERNKSLETPAHDWGEKFSSLFHVYTNNLPQSPPQEQRAAAPSGNARAGIKGEQDPWVRTCKHRHEVQRERTNLAEITGLELLQRSQIAAVDGTSHEQRQDLRMGNEQLGF